MVEAYVGSSGVLTVPSTGDVLIQAELESERPGRRQGGRGQPRRHRGRYRREPGHRDHRRHHAGLHERHPPGREQPDRRGEQLKHRRHGYLRARRRDQPVRIRRGGAGPRARSTSIRPSLPTSTARQAPLPSRWTATSSSARSSTRARTPTPRGSPSAPGRRSPGSVARDEINPQLTTYLGGVVRHLRERLDLPRVAGELRRRRRPDHAARDHRHGQCHLRVRRHPLRGGRRQRGDGTPNLDTSVEAGTTAQAGANFVVLTLSYLNTDAEANSSQVALFAGGQALAKAISSGTLNSHVDGQVTAGTSTTATNATADSTRTSRPPSTAPTPTPYGFLIGIGAVGVATDSKTAPTIEAQMGDGASVAVTGDAYTLAIAEDNANPTPGGTQNKIPLGRRRRGRPPDALDADRPGGQAHGHRLEPVRAAPESVRPARLVRRGEPRPRRLRAPGQRARPRSPRPRPRASPPAAPPS